MVKTNAIKLNKRKGRLCLSLMDVDSSPIHEIDKRESYILMDDETIRWLIKGLHKYLDKGTIYGYCRHYPYRTDICSIDDNRNDVYEYK